MKTIQHYLSTAGLVVGLTVGLYAGAVSAATLNIAESPLFLTTPVKPAVMVMLDNSGSMKDAMYQPGLNSLKSGFDPSTAYYGIFDANKNYVYDPGIPVNTGAYNVPIDSDVEGAFVESTCTPAPADLSCWSGRFLNWMTTRRIDSTRVVLVGGKLESRSAYDYDGDGDADTGLSYKLLGNSERSDRTLRRKYSDSSSYSPLADNTIVTVASPAESGNTQSAYKPYATMSSAGGSGIIYNDAGDPIGEFGQVSVNHNWGTVNYLNSYSSTPVVVAKPPTFNGPDPSVVRLKSIGNSSFQIRVQEFEYKDGSHANETLNYVVLKTGVHSLDGSVKMIAGTKNTDKNHVSNDCGNGENDDKSVNFSSSFSSTPVVISSVQTVSGARAVNSRTWNINSGGFKVALQGEENQPEHTSTETIGYIAVEQGQVNDTGNATSFSLEADTQNNIDENIDTLNFTTSFTAAPVFVAALQSMNDRDTATLRLTSLDKNRAKLRIQEEKSCDGEENHSNEQFGYIAIEGGGVDLNVALAVADEPTGLLQDVKDDVQLGISFYRYDPNAGDIYNSNKIDGGTIKFKIPLNPFVKNPGTNGGYRDLSGYTGTPIADIIDTIEHYPLIWGTTPIAENLHEVIRYFEQASPYYSSSDFDLADGSNPERDPYYSVEFGRKLMCIRSNVLIFTDGEPYRDAGLPSFFNNYDGDSDVETASTTANASSPTGDIGILDDVGFWSYCDNALTPSCSGSDAQGNRDLRLDTELGGNQFLRIDTVGFADGNIRQTLQDTADNAGGTAYAAEDGAALADVLREAFAAAVTVGASSSVAANSTRLGTNTFVYQALFDSSDWSGRVQAFVVDTTDGSIDTSATPAWDTDTAGKIPSYGSRFILSMSPVSGGTGIDFTWANLTASQRATLREASETDDSLAALRVPYIRGDQSNEEQNGGVFRDRNKLLGDIVHSNPWFVGSQDFGLTSSVITGGALYTPFRNAISGRSRVLYVGANDGMLHALKASTGQEMFAYIPSTVIPRLKNLSNPNYGGTLAHQNFVDGSPRAGDVFYGGAWQTILAGTLGSGGRGIYALNVTYPDSFNASKVMWEFDNNSTNGGDLGFTLGEPTIALMQNDTWSVIVGNGYNSDNDRAVLYILDAEDGSIIKKIDTGVGSSATPNGLATPVPIDFNGDKIVDVIYAGDLLGNMWKFNVSDSNPNNWALSFGTNPLSTSVDDNGVAQPITTKPRVGPHPNGGLMVYFGTGKYFEVDDNIVGSSPQVQTFYGIRDNYANGTTLPVNGRTDLAEQEILAEGALLGFTARITSDNTVDYPNDVGWYMDLESPVNGPEGERVVSPAVIRGDRLIFVTLIPSQDPCETGGTGWLMEVEAFTGQRLTYSPFDISGDGSFTSADKADFFDINGDGTIDGDDLATVTGLRSTIGIIQSPNVISAGNKEYLNFQGSSGDVGQVTGNNLDDAGRMSWRQLR